MLRQAVMEATDGRIDYFLTNSNFPKFAAFAFEFPMQSNRGAMFGDDDKGYFEEGIRNYLESTFSKSNTPHYNDSYLNYNDLFMAFIMKINLKMNRKYRFPVEQKISFEKNKRKYYSDANVLVCRGDTLAVVFKLLGGREKDPTGAHNHDDAGSYQIMKNEEIITGDVGGGIFYEGNWKERFNRSIFNSYSHPVPIIDNQLQIRNTIYYMNLPRPKVLKTHFSDEFDEIVFDLKAAYNCSSLLSLHRTNIFKREIGRNQVIIEDNVEFSKPTKFEIAIVSRGSIYMLQKINLNTLAGKITFNNETLSFTVKAQNEFGFLMKNESTNGVTFERLGILFKNLVKKAKIAVTYI